MTNYALEKELKSKEIYGEIAMLTNDSK